MSYSIDVRSSTIALPQGLRHRLERWARRSYPNEACGLLIGRREERQRETVVVEVVAGRNLDTAHASVRFELDPADHVAAEDMARRRGLEVVGIWHSHPDHPARPSEADRTHAWSGWCYLIVSVDPSGAHELRAWRLEQEAFVEEEIVP